MDEREKEGWKVVSGGVLIMLMLGVTYTWSVFAGPLMEHYGWNHTEVQLAFSLMLAVFALSMIPAGMLQDKHGPRVVALAGGILLGFGFVLTGVFASSPLLLYATYGVLVGAGVGLAYGTPIAAGIKWFKKKRGLVSGIIVFGFGFGSLLLAPFAKELIVSYGIGHAFIVLGISFVILVSIGALLLKNPPESKSKKTHLGDREFGPKAMLAMPQFWMLWIMFAFSAAAGLMVIGNLATFAKLSFTTAHSMENDAAFSLATLAVGGLAIFNGAGRILAGWLSDRVGGTKTMFVMFGFQAVLLASLVFVSDLSPWALFISMALIGLCFGANFSLFPSSTADFFGTRHIGVNYGIVFTAYGFGGILGPQVMAYMLDSVTATGETLSVGDYATPFMLLGGLVGISALLSMFTKKP
ncbi:MAG: OFA family MFS transporter [Candidatus Micrarchaeota archaeon]